ncbi:MAG: short-subunit dehydrogenase [Cognaticolwellia sp.]|jgi:short-subunit dehydrogenase
MFPGRILITGASTGLGLAIARELQSVGAHLVLTARPSSMQRFAALGFVDSKEIWLRPLDVTNVPQREALMAEIDATEEGLYALINNAGLSYRAVVEDVAEEDRLHQMNVNFRSPMALAVLALPGMRRRGRGRIISVSSVGGMMAMPTMAVYSASKFALEGASEAMWYEVRPWNIYVTLVQPGFIQSDGFEKVRITDKGLASMADPDSPYNAHYTHMADFIAQAMQRVPATPESVARKVCQVLKSNNPPLRKAATLDAWLFAGVRRLLPRRFYHWLLYQMLPNIRAWGPRI